MTTFYDDHLLNIFGFFWLRFGGQNSKRIHSYIKMYCGNCKESCVKHYTFTPHNAKLTVNLDKTVLSIRANVCLRDDVIGGYK